MSRIPLLPALLFAAIGSALAQPAAAPAVGAQPVQAHTRTLLIQRQHGAAPSLLAQARPHVLPMPGTSRGPGGLPDPVTKPVLIRDEIRGPQLGVILAPDDQRGVGIIAVTPGSAAAQVGLRSGDRLLSVDGKPVDGKDGDARLQSARALLGKLETGKVTRIGYLRDGRDAKVEVTPRVGERVMVFENADGSQMVASGRVEILRSPDGTLDVSSDSFEYTVADAAVAPRMRTEIHRIGPDQDCKGKPCPLPMISEALRWNGLNLATVDAKLGRYFGAQRGVLVLSAGPKLKGLEAGDVIQSIDGRAVASPREAMEALRDKPEGTQVEIGYLRDRASAKLKLTLPKAVAWVPPAPPAPPAPPPPPRAPSAPVPPAPPAPAAAPAPPPPPPPASNEVSAAPAPPSPPSPPRWATTTGTHIYTQRVD
ncbi:PDZ domain-containing protein [Lysobacter sp. CA199]|uniref:PDZ domain-containing protein n=1 Tax=Lysobacter sp. CA199 TaxID=3455608 RepID=UPI003F8D8A06